MTEKQKYRLTVTLDLESDARTKKELARDVAMGLHHVWQKIDALDLPTIVSLPLNQNWRTKYKARWTLEARDDGR